MKDRVRVRRLGGIEQAFVMAGTFLPHNFITEYLSNLICERGV